jgi:hypothetical protein
LPNSKDFSPTRQEDIWLSWIIIMILSMKL